MVKVSPAGAVDLLWPMVKDLIQGALDHSQGEMTLEQVKSYIDKDEMRLSVAHEGEKILGAIVTEIVQYPDKKALRVVFIGGEDFEAWIEPLNDYLSVGAKAIDASFIEAFVRPGLVKLTKKVGWSSGYSVIVRHV